MCCMGSRRGRYTADFDLGETVRIRERDVLETFRRPQWKYHHPIVDEQFAFAGRLAVVRQGSFYHGGDELYELTGVPGIWHEGCLETVTALDRLEPVVADSRPIKFVIGYHDFSEPPTADALGARLLGRVAAVLDTYRPSSVGWVFDEALWQALLHAVSAWSRSDRTEIHALPPRRRGLFSFLRARQSARLIGTMDDIESLISKTDEPPDRVHWYRGRTLVAVGLTEPWVLVGGPEPYHDSYTLSVFVETGAVESLACALEGAAMRAGATVTGLTHASATLRRSWWARLLSV